jgi:hypothetical protein
VHATLGRKLDEIAEELSETEGRTPAARLYSNSYRGFSNYVHAKYLLAAVRIRAKTAENLTDGRRTGGAAVGCGLSDRKFDCLPPTIGL